MALRAEECLKKHLVYSFERQRMKEAIARSKKFTSGCEGLAEVDSNLLDQAHNEEVKAKKAFKPKITPLAADPKLCRAGRKKKTAEVKTSKDSE